MFNSNSRPWKCKRTEFELILFEKVYFHFLASGRRRGPVKKSEKNIFWKSTNFMFNCNSRPWKCKRTELESILVEKVSFHFFAQGHRRGPAKSSEKNIFWKSTNFMFNSNSRPWKCKRTEFELILVEKVSFHFLAQGHRCRPAKSSEKLYFENPQILCSFAKAGPENANEQHSNKFWLKKFHFIFWPQAAGADLWKNLIKMYFENPPILCSIATAGDENAREQNWNRFWLKKFHFIFWLKAAGGDLRKVLKKVYFENP